MYYLFKSVTYHSSQFHKQEFLHIYFIFANNSVSGKNIIVLYVQIGLCMCGHVCTCLLIIYVCVCERARSLVHTHVVNKFTGKSTSSKDIQSCRTHCLAQILRVDCIGAKYIFKSELYIPKEDM